MIDSRLQNECSVQLREIFFLPVQGNRCYYVKLVWDKDIIVCDELMWVGSK
jgi:hypothetical protein